MKTLSHANAKKDNKKVRGFQVSHVYWPFSSDSMVMKGLRDTRTTIHANYSKITAMQINRNC